MNWLSPLELHKRHEDVRAKRSEGTGTWFLNTPEFLNWSNKQNVGDNYAICSFGDPGAGKTIMW